MYQIEKIGVNTFFLKARGNFPPKVAQELKRDFLDKIGGLEYFSFIVDLLDVILISLDTLKMLLGLLKQNNDNYANQHISLEIIPPRERIYVCY